jgi:hypothetical protein
LTTEQGNTFDNESKFVRTTVEPRRDLAPNNAFDHDSKIVVTTVYSNKDHKSRESLGSKNKEKEKSTRSTTKLVRTTTNHVVQP